MRKRVIWVWVALFTLLIPLLGSCGPASPGATPAPTAAGGATAAPTGVPLGRDPKTLVVAIYSNPSDFDPASNNEQLGNMVLVATNEGLVRVKADNIEEFEPQLAERWEHNADYTVWTFYLRKNAKFHDGTPVNAQAVKFSFTRLVKAGLGMSYILAQFLEDPDSQIVVKDDYTVEFRFEQPTPLFIKALSSGYGAFVISPSAVQAHEKNGDMAHEWLQTHEAGSGAYMLTEYSPNQQVVLTRFDDWWGWEQYPGFRFDKIVLQIVPEMASRRSLIEKGDVDIALDFSPEDLDALAKNPDIVVHRSETLAVRYIVLGQYGPLADPRVRQAIAYAFDYEGYVNNVLKGTAQRARGPFPHKLQCWDPDVFVYPTDLEKAKQLLQEAGVQPGLELRFMCEEMGWPVQVAQILQAQLAQLGINLKIEQRDTSTYSGIFYGDVQWPERPELMAWGWWPDYNDPTDYAWPLFHSQAAGSAGANAGFYKNARVDEILDTAPSITDTEKLCALYKEFQDIVVRQDPAWIPLVERPDVRVLRKDIGGFQANPLYVETFDFFRLYRIGY